MIPPLIDLADAADAHSAVVGGKALTLGRMKRLGLPVPPGLVVTAPALASGITPALAENLQAEITRRGWAEKALAVRSSAPQEDSATASFAGIFHSELDVRGFAAIQSAVARVYGSRDTPQAVAYRSRKGIADDGMAVLVMPLLDAHAAGVAFTCDPVSGRDDRIVMQAVHGLADRLVGGTENGAEIVLAEERQSETLSVLNQRAAEGQSMPLTEAQALALGHLLRDAAQALDYADPAFDFEWVFDGQEFWLVQARPVTARPWHTYPALAGQEALWSNGNTRDVVPHVMGAMDWIGWRRMVDMMLEQGYRLAGYPLLSGARRSALMHGRLYLNASFIQWEAFDALGFAPSALNELMGGHHPEIAVPAPSLGDRMRRLGRLLRFIARSPACRQRGRQQAEAAFEDAAQFRGETPASWSDDQLAARLREVTEKARTREGLMFLQGSSGGNLYLLLELVGKAFPTERHALVAAIMAGGPPSITARQAYELRSLAAIAAEEPKTHAFLAGPPPRDLADLPKDSRFRTALNDFLRKYGHRGIYESYLASPRFAENTDYLLDLISAEINGSSDRRRDAEAQRQAISEEAWAKLRGRLSPLQRWRARMLVKLAQTESNERELARSAMTVYGAEMRRLLLEIARRICARGLLKRPEDIFDLTPHEALAALLGQSTGHCLTARVSWRRSQRQAYEKGEAPEVVLGNRALPAAEPHRQSARTWNGIAVGAGVAEGAARRIDSPEQGDRLLTGEILIAPSTDPAWTPLFLRAGGLVMETGGYLSHGAIVAREFGIPAVVNLPGIRARVRDGDRIRVDGQRGEVTFVD
ncbi:PEP/pyruvate-binding domain-containing protein [Candidatus Accumulibacter sp. ACC003]|uniref:PEP/pyruvate-binding domain-containing protein n=1 Tax=Candidatus Accumulibacter sp. ACC003 TaxID=2823334 RepID=UPI0025BD19B1|nr:PEP/pyruvate-binding domain-containing protein [Candidatus Accumulibacter sp. ACC003]